MGWNDDNNSNLPPAGLVRDGNWNTVGEIIHTGNGAYIRDTSGNAAGWYDAAANVTRDSSWNVVGQGNWLVALVSRR